MTSFIVNSSSLPLRFHSHPHWQVPDAIHSCAGDFFLRVSMSHLEVLDHDLPFQALLGPLSEVENKSARLQGIQCHLLELTDLFSSEDSIVAEQLHDAAGKVEQSAQYFYNKRRFILLPSAKRCKIPFAVAASGSSLVKCECMSLTLWQMSRKKKCLLMFLPLFNTDYVDYIKCLICVPSPPNPPNPSTDPCILPVFAWFVVEPQAQDKQENQPKTNLQPLKRENVQKNRSWLFTFVLFCQKTTTNQKTKKQKTNQKNSTPQGDE